MIASKKKALLLILGVVFFQCFEAKKFGGGGGSRGSSGARMGPPPSQQGMGGGGWGAGGAGAHPPAGGFGQQPHFSGGGIPHQQPNFRPPSGGGPGHFGGGSGLGSASRGSSFKTALAGAALGTVGGLLAFEAGKAIINSFDKPIHYENRDYYWGQEYARRRPDEHVCTYDFDKLISQTPTVAPPPAPAEGGPTTPSPDQALAHATFPNGTRPKQIVWTCKNNEQCCGTDCCPMPPQSSVSRTNGAESSSVAGTIGKIILVLLLIGLLICCCCGLILYKFCRSTFDSLNPVRTNNEPYDPSKYENQQQPPQYNTQAQSYPMQPYPNTQSAYPPQPQPPATYPAYPPAPGYNYGGENKY